MGSAWRGSDRCNLRDDCSLEGPQDGQGAQDCPGQTRNGSLGCELAHHATTRLRPVGGVGKRGAQGPRGSRGTAQERTSRKSTVMKQLVERCRSSGEEDGAAALKGN